MFAGGHDQMRQTQNGFAKNQWKPSEHEGVGGLQPEDDDSDEEVDEGGYEGAIRSLQGIGW